MNTITYTKFNEKPEYYMKEIFNTKEDTVILKNGKPYLKIYHIPENNKINPLKNSIIFEKDLISPINVDWESDK
jgi:hypothetical protein